MSTVELEIARIAVLETKVETIKEDIVEIKTISKLCIQELIIPQTN